MCKKRAKFFAECKTTTTTAQSRRRHNTPIIQREDVSEKGNMRVNLKYHVFLRMFYLQKKIGSSKSAVGNYVAV